MAEIIFQKAVCAECEKEIPAFSVAEVYTDEFVVCIECNEALNSDWEEFQELLRSGKFHQDI